jgi:hypothetical protein
LLAHSHHGSFGLKILKMGLPRPGAEFAARLGVDPLVIPGNHLTMLTQPAIVADALLSVL